MNSHIYHLLKCNFSRDGIIKTCHRIVVTLVDLIHDLKSGIYTWQRHSLAQKNILSKNKENATEYSPTPASALRKLFSKIELPQNSHFVDIGSGKGRVLLLASAYRFTKIIGIEFCRDFVEIAERNITHSQRKNKHAMPPIEMYLMDASEYRFSNSDNVIYMFDPFNSIVLNEVLRNLQNSIDSFPRQIYLIYLLPAFDEQIRRFGLFSFMKYYTIDSYLFAIYSNYEIQLRKCAAEGKPSGTEIMSGK